MKKKSLEDILNPEKNSDLKKDDKYAIVEEQITLNEKNFS
jgi:hypothetical protein